MSISSSSQPRPHMGNNIEKIRLLRGKKQEFLALSLGISQQAVDRMEQSQDVDKERHQKVADALEVPITAIKNFNEEKAINFFANMINNHDQSVSVFYNPMFNPIDKITDLFKQLLKSERERITLLEKLLKKFQLE